MNNIYSPAVVAETLARHGLSPQKRLGQNFLVDKNALERILAAADVPQGGLAIEIGPGLGVLTEELAKRAGRVIAVEIDKRLLPPLTERLAPYGNVSIINADALDIDYAALIAESGFESAVAAANLPYYITTPLLFKLLEARERLSGIVVMTQLEVARRLTAKAGGKGYGALSVMAQRYAEAGIAAKVSRNCFYPKPDVDSAVTRLTPRPQTSANDGQFRALVKAAFGKRRKTLANCLADALGMDKQTAAALLQAQGFRADVRGEALTPTDFAALANRLSDIAPNF